MFTFNLLHLRLLYLFFFFNDTATTEIYTLSLHDALPICIHPVVARRRTDIDRAIRTDGGGGKDLRSEEHTSELQSQSNLVCRLLLEKKKKHNQTCIWSHNDLPRQLQRGHADELSASLSVC